MTITIPAFWCGVIATIGVEFIALIVYGVIASATRNKPRRK